MDSFFAFLRNLGFRRGPRRLLAGIGGGVADATGADPVLVRVLMILAMLLPVIGPTLYIVLWVLLPWQDGTIPLQRLVQHYRSNRDGHGGGDEPTIVQE